MHCELMWAFRRSRRAFRYIFARSISTPLPNSRFPSPNPVPCSRSPFPVPAWLAKDAAPIPNAFESTSQRVNESTSYCNNKIGHIMHLKKTNSSVGAKDYKQTVSTQCGTSAQTNHDRPERCRRDRTIIIEMRWAYIF